MLAIASLTSCLEHSVCSLNDSHYYNILFLGSFRYSSPNADKEICNNVLKSILHTVLGGAFYNEGQCPNLQKCSRAGNAQWQGRPVGKTVPVFCCVLGPGYVLSALHIFSNLIRTTEL